MRVLTVRQPWAWAIIHGGKNVENRTRNIAGAYRGPVAIHAGKNFGTMVEYARATRTVARITGGLPNEEPTGVIIGVVDIVGVHQAGHPHWCQDSQCALWADPTGAMFHIELGKPRPLDPIPATGRLGLWNPDAELLGKILEGLNP